LGTTRKNHNVLAMGGGPSTETGLSKKRMGEKTQKSSGGEKARTRSESAMKKGMLVSIHSGQGLPESGKSPLGRGPPSEGYKRIIGKGPNRIWGKKKKRSVEEGGEPPISGLSPGQKIENWGSKNHYRRLREHPRKKK